MGQSKRSGRGPRDEAVFARQPFMMGTRVVLRHSGGLLDLQQIVEPNYQQLGKKNEAIRNVLGSRTIGSTSFPFPGQRQVSQQQD